MVLHWEQKEEDIFGCHSDGQGSTGVSRAENAKCPSM